MIVKLNEKVCNLETKKNCFKCFVRAYVSIKSTESFRANILKTGNNIFYINVQILNPLLNETLIKFDLNKFLNVQKGIQTK